MYYLFEINIFKDFFYPINVSILNQILIKLNLIKDNCFILLIFFLIYKFLKPEICVLIFLSFLNIYFNKTIIIINFYSGYYKIHPILFYFSIILSLHYYSANKLQLKTSLAFISLLQIISFILGSFWALYQIIWGKYWSTDYIEVILMYNYVLLLTFFHKIKKKKINFFFNSINGLLILIFLRVNILHTKHSFFNKKSNNIFIIYLLIYTFFVNKKQNLYKIILNTKSSKLFIYLFTLIILINIDIKMNIFKNSKYTIIITFIMAILLIININFKIVIHVVNIIILFIFINYSIYFFKFTEINLPKEKTNNLFFFYYKKLQNIYIYKKNNFTYKLNLIKFSFFDFKGDSNLFKIKFKTNTIINQF